MHHITGKSRPKILLLSINPDLKSDFGHFLNYERRINQVCQSIGVAHHCLCNVEFTTNLSYFSPVLKKNSGQYGLIHVISKETRADICRELHEAITTWLEAEETLDQYDFVIAFIYQSSSAAAVYLKDLEWPPGLQMVCNAFWDFRFSPPSADDETFVSLKRSGPVSLMAMSSPHSKQIYDATGLEFVTIPHPPPLVSDAHFYDVLRWAAQEKADRHRELPPTVFLPGLLSLGKGQDVTEEFVASEAREKMTARILVRDRQGVLGRECPASKSSNLQYLTEDYSDSEIIGYYRQADVVALPYTSDVFGVRTSGALVDCMMSDVVPVVFPDTWLAYICKEFGFGIVCAGNTAADMADGINAALKDLPIQQQRTFFAAIRYMEENSWGRFLEVLLNEGGRGAAIEDVRERSWSYLQSAQKASVVLLEGEPDFQTVLADSARWWLVNELFEEEPEYLMEENA